MEQAELSRIRSFVAERLRPLEELLVPLRWNDIERELRDVRGEVRDRGWLTPHLPSSAGGAGLSLTEFGRLSAVLGRSPIGHLAFNCQAPDAGNMELLLAHGSDAQRERFLAPLARGEIRSCFAMTEPDRAGSNPTWLETTARRDGADYVIDGRKWFATGGDGAAVAIVMAVTDTDDAAAHERASMFLVPTDTEGYEPVRKIPVMGETGTGYFSHLEIRFDGCRVPAEQRLGPEGEGFRLAQARLAPGRIHHCMRWIGVCERALEMACERAATRETAPGRALGERQAVQHALAESRAELDAARLLVEDTARIVEEEGGRAARSRISLIKFHVAGVLQRVLDDALQIHGALGMTDDTPLAFWWRHERAARIYDGPDEVHKSLVARRMLREHGLEVEG